jgi:hypothetical protein
MSDCDDICDDDRSSQAKDDSNMEIVETTNNVETHIDTTIATKFNTNTTSSQNQISPSQGVNTFTMNIQSISIHTPKRIALRISEQRPPSNKKTQVDMLSTALDNITQTISNKAKMKEIHPKMKALSKVIEKETNSQTSENNVSKRNKKNKKEEFSRVIIEEILIQSINAQPIKRGITSVNLHPNWTPETRLDEVESNEMEALASLGHTMEFLPTDMIPQIIDTFIKMLQDSALEPDNIQLLKRVFIFPTIVTLKPGTGSLRANMRKTNFCSSSLPFGPTLFPATTLFSSLSLLTSAAASLFPAAAS